MPDVLQTKYMIREGRVAPIYVLDDVGYTDIPADWLASDVDVLLASDDQIQLRVAETVPRDHPWVSALITDGVWQARQALGARGLHDYLADADMRVSAGGQFAPGRLIPPYPTFEVDMYTGKLDQDDRYVHQGRVVISTGIVDTANYAVDMDTTPEENKGFSKGGMVLKQDTPDQGQQKSPVDEDTEVTVERTHAFEDFGTSSADVDDVDIEEQRENYLTEDQESITVDMGDLAGFLGADGNTPEPVGPVDDEEFVEYYLDEEEMDAMNTMNKAIFGLSDY